MFPKSFFAVLFVALLGLAACCGKANAGEGLQNAFELAKPGHGTGCPIPGPKPIDICMAGAFVNYLAGG